MGIPPRPERKLLKGFEETVPGLGIELVPASQKGDLHEQPWHSGLSIKEGLASLGMN